MDTGILTPKKLFQRDIRYTVPTFQRRYVWTQDGQWEPLWDDVRNLAETYLEKLAESNGNKISAEQESPRHFLGAVVVQQVSTATRDIEQREVIDGQQRLTTLQLLLDAVQFVFERRGADREAKRLSKLVTNDEDLIVDDHHVFKLWPTRSDREAFRHAMHNGLPTDQYENSNIVQAHEYFQLQANQWLDSGNQETPNRVEALETALTGMLQMVVIDLNPDDNPHVIFETLNARGTPLLESDLIKNYVAAKVAEFESKNVWGDLEDNWWKEDFRQGRLIRPRIDALLDYWLEMKEGDDVSAGRVFSVFRTHSEGQDIEKIMTEVRTDLTNFRRYENGPRAPFEDIFYYRAEVMQVGAFTPALLAMLSQPQSVRMIALPALESFLVRRMLCRLTTKDYNRLALDLVREIREVGTDGTGSAIVKFLRSQEANSRYWPTDDELEQALCTLPLYRLLTRGRLRLVLEGIEGKYRQSIFAEQEDVPKGLTIEHVLPQSWEAHWPLPVAVDEEEARKERNRILHTIGNLTLVTRRLNSLASNARWEQKRETLSKHAVFCLNRVLLSEAMHTAWDEEMILARSKGLAKLIADVWRGPHTTEW